MIDVSEIKDFKELTEMKDDLNFFLNKKIVAEIYKSQELDAEDLEEDRYMARELLENVQRRLTQLSQPVKRPGSRPHRRGT